MTGSYIRRISAAFGGRSDRSGNERSCAKNSGSKFCILGAILCAFLAGYVFAQTDYSLIKGTVFTPEGQSFQGAKVTIFRTDTDAKHQKKSRKEAFSDRRGEFAFRMDVGPAKYHLSVEARGFPKQERDVSIWSDERADVAIVLNK